MNLPNGYCLQNGKYRLAEVIGQGGFGITYLGVWNTEVKGPLGRVKTEVPICIKEYFFKEYCSRDEETLSIELNSQAGKLVFDKFKEKLIIEAKILSEVHHPYIVNVLEVFEENNTAYIAMEHIAGCSLKYMLDKEGKALPEKKVLKYINQIGQALDFVHQKNILHLDIKPSNILIDKNDNARLIDFGVSKRYDLDQEETNTAILTLSKGFAPIEQYDKEGIQTFSPCPDVYSLGATMYNLLTGDIPVESILRATKPLIKPRVANSLISQQTEDVILKAMQVNPENRYQSVISMIRDLDIPSYFETSQNLLREEYHAYNYKREADETKLQMSSIRGLNNNQDEEQTIIKQIDSTSLIVDKRKRTRRRRILIPIMLIAFAFLLGAATFMLNLNQSEPFNINNLVANVSDDPLDPLTKQTLTDDLETYSMDLTNKVDSLKTQNNTQKALHNPDLVAEQKPLQNNVQLPKDKPNVQPTVNEVNSVITPSTEEIEADYSRYIASGKSKMEQMKFSEARKDFSKAKDLKMTEEVFQLELSCRQKQEEKEIADRKALYEEILSFGNFTVVKKKQNGLYGAINHKAEESIKCIYIGLGRSKNGISFEREDHLWDIFNEQGKIVGNGLNDY